MDTIENLRFQNKHWTDGKFNVFGYKRDIFTKIWKDLDTKLMSLITGPRRVGKSVILKQIAQELILKRNINPNQILFYEFISNDKSEAIWDVFNYFTTEIADIRLPIYVFFDEIQYVDGYESEIKNLYDNTNNCKFFLTGSLSLSYKRRMQDSLAGRFFLYKLFPLNFLEFIKLKKLGTLSTYNDALIEKDKFRKQGQLSILNSDFRKFLEIGRYPETINLEPEQNKTYLQNILNQSLNQDVYSYFQIEKPIIINAIFNHIRQNNGGLISINKFAQQLGVANNTISTYLDILELMGLVYLVYNSTNPLIKLQSSKKAYVNSSFGLLDSKLDYSTSLGFAVESYVLERLLEKDEQVTFYRNRQKEIDFLLPKRNVGYEVKFRSEIPKTPNLKDFELKTISLNGDIPACLF